MTARRGWRCPTTSAQSGGGSELTEVYELGRLAGAYQAATGGLDRETLAKLAKVKPDVAAALLSIARQLRGDT